MGMSAWLNLKDIDRTFDQILPGYTLETAPWEAVHMHRDIWVAAFVPSNSACTLVLIPNEHWLPDRLRRVLCANLVPESHVISTNTGGNPNGNTKIKTQS